MQFLLGEAWLVLNSQVFNFLSWGTNFLLGRTALLTSCFSNVSSFKASPDIGVGSSNMYLGGYFSVFEKQLDLLGIKFFQLYILGMYFLFLGKRLDLLISEFSNFLSWGTNYSLGGESALLVSCFLIHIWGCFLLLGSSLTY